MGSERRSMIITDEEKKVTAIHEAGHALLAVLLPHADPVHKVTIIPRGMALGVTMQLPVDDKHNYTRDYLNDQIAILLGGRIAEEITMRRHDDRRRQRPRALDRARAQDGLRVGHERRDGAAHLRQEGRADLPRPRDRAAPGLQRRHGDPHRSGDQAVRHEQLRARRRRCSSSTASRSTDRRGAPRPRGARRRTGPPHRRRRGRSKSTSRGAAAVVDGGSRAPPRRSARRWCRRSTSRSRRNDLDNLGIWEFGNLRFPRFPNFQISK